MRAIWKKNMKILNLDKRKKIWNPTESEFGDLMCSTAIQNLPKPPIDLKIFPICSGLSMVNLLVYGQLFSASNCPIAMLLGLRWNPPQPNLWRHKKAGGSFKSRFYKHQSDFRHAKNELSSCLSKYIWKLKRENLPGKYSPGRSIQPCN